MDASFLAILCIFALIVLAFVLMIIRAKRENRQTFEETVKKSWGTNRPRLFSHEELASIKCYSQSVSSSEEEQGRSESSVCTIDDITAKDIDLDTIFERISGGIQSSPGAEVLYSWLRHPLLSRQEVSKRICAQDYFDAHQEERLRVQRILFEMSFLKGGAFYPFIRSLKEASPIGKTRFLLAGLATLGAIVLLFFKPLLGIAALFVLLIINYRIHMGMKERTLSAIRGFQAMERLMEGGSELAKVLPEDVFSDEILELRERLKALAAFRSGSFLVTSGGNVGTGVADAILEYVKLFFHIDLIQFDRMLAVSSNHEEDVLRLLELCGSLDAACAAASFRCSMPVSCRPAFLDGKEGASLSASQLAHPLLEEPIRNDLVAGQPVLLTGSNASGKSTFLKAVALTAVLAQSIGVVDAKEYKAPLFRIFSSMALSDNLLEGESYFIVEIKSLKRILDASYEEGAPVLAFIDEVLRGTNTVERIAASAQILSALAQNHALVFAATHDIELSYLLEGSYANRHFQESTVDGDLHFDYLLRQGRAEAGNALALLAGRQYPPQIVDQAAAMVKRFEDSGVWAMDDPAPV